MGGNLISHCLAITKRQHLPQMLTHRLFCRQVAYYDIRWSIGDVPEHAWVNLLQTCHCRFYRLLMLNLYVLKQHQLTARFSKHKISFQDPSAPAISGMEPLYCSLGLECHKRLSYRLTTLPCILKNTHIAHIRYLHWSYHCRQLHLLQSICLHNKKYVSHNHLNSQ